MPAIDLKHYPIQAHFEEASQFIEEMLAEKGAKCQNFPRILMGFKASSYVFQEGSSCIASKASGESALDIYAYTIKTQPQRLEQFFGLKKV